MSLFEERGSFLEEAEFRSTRVRKIDHVVVVLHVNQVDMLTQEIRSLRQELRASERQAARTEDSAARALQVADTSPPLGSCEVGWLDPLRLPG